MKIFNSILIVGFFLISINFYAQEKQKDFCSTSTLFEYGIPVLQSEDNLKNLFKNFPVLIENGKEIDFLSYQFMGTIKGRKDAKKYVQKNFDDLIPIGWSISSQSDDNGQPGKTPSVRLHPEPIRESQSELKRMAKTISEEYVQPGDEVYRVNYVFNLQKHVHYIFINPKTKKVLLKGNIFGFEIPMTHIQK